MARFDIFIVIIQLGWTFGHENYDKYPLEKGVHSIDKGERKDGDSKLYSETLRGKSDSFDDYDEHCYPPKSSTDQIKITEYEVKDQDEANKGGLAFEVSGGEGQGQVCFVLKSPSGKSYNYKVDIYGYRLINGVIVKENMGGGVGAGSFGTPGGVGSGYGNMGAGYGAFGSGLGITGAGYGAAGSGPGNMGAGYGAFGSGLGITGAGYGAAGSGPGNMGAGYGAFGSVVGNAPGFGGVGPERFGASGLNTNNNLNGGSYGQSSYGNTFGGYGSTNPTGGYGSGIPNGGYGSGNPTGGYGSGNTRGYGPGFKKNDIDNRYGQNQLYGSGKGFNSNSRGPFKK